MQDRSNLKPALIRIGIALVLLAAAVGFLLFRQRQPDKLAQRYDITTVPPTCVDAGYSLYTSKENGATFTDDIIPALGHTYGEQSILQPLGAISPEISGRTCAVCGMTEEQVRYPDTSIPRLALDGDLSGIGKKNEVPITASFISEERNFSAFATLKYQGHSTLQYDKKNYTLKLYEDQGRQEKWKMTFSHWNPENKYILKANYMDPSQCRNLVCADIWADVAASRASLPPVFQSLSNYGAVDGFPIALYVNREYQGLYTFNLHKDDDLFAMKDGEEQAILIANDGSADEAFFRAQAVFEEDSPWEVEFCGTEDSTWAKDKLNRLIAFVMESDDETFRTQLSEQLDVTSAIDYLLSVYVMGLTNYDENDLILVCYEKDQPFTASMYDMDSAFGLSEDGTAAALPEQHLPTVTDGRWDSATGNLLWERLLQNFQPEITRRYAELREALFTPENLCKRVLDFTNAIPAALTEADNTVYPHPNPTISHADQITSYITRRIPLLDNLFLNGES